MEYEPDVGEIGKASVEDAGSYEHCWRYKGEMFHDGMKIKVLEYERGNPLVYKNGFQAKITYIRTG